MVTWHVTWLKTNLDFGMNRASLAIRIMSRGFRVFPGNGDGRNITLRLLTTHWPLSVVYVVHAASRDE